MKLFIIGGTGVISREIVRQSLAKGYDVAVFNRGSGRAALPENVEIIHGDRTNTEDLRKAAEKTAPDVVIDMTCFDAALAEQTVTVFGDISEQIIVTSSIAAYERPYHSYPIRECDENLSTFEGFSYSFQKAEAERYLQSVMGKIKAAITIIRPSLTFGPGAANFGMLRQNRNVVRRIREGKPVVMLGEGVIPWSFTFVEDLAGGFVLSCQNTNTYNDCFHIVNTEVVMWEDLYRAVGRCVGKEPKFAYIPTDILKDLMPSVCGHLHYEKVHFSVFDVSKFKKAAPEYAPKVKLDEGVKTLVDWWEETDFPYDEEKDALEDKICELYRKFRSDILALTTD